MQALAGFVLPAPRSFTYATCWGQSSGIWRSPAAMSVVRRRSNQRAAGTGRLVDVALLHVRCVPPDVSRRARSARRHAAARPETPSL